MVNLRPIGNRPSNRPITGRPRDSNCGRRRWRYCRRAADAYFAHTIEGGALGHGDRVTFEALQGVREFLHFDKESGLAGGALWGELGSILQHAFDGLEHHLGAIAHQNDEADTPSGTSTVFSNPCAPPRRRASFDTFHNQNGGDLRYAAMLKNGRGGGMKKRTWGCRR